MSNQGKVIVGEVVVEEMALAVRTPAGALWGGAVVYDDSPLWSAWQTAQAAWLESKRRRSGGENTVRAYELAVRQFFGFASVTPWQVSSAQAQEWVGAMAAKGLAQATVNLKLAALSSFYDFVQRRYAMQTPDHRDVSLWPADRANPFAMVERAKVSPYGRARYPSTGELQEMLAHVNMTTLSGKRDFALLYTVATTCRRSSEVTNLKWGDLEELATGDYAFRYRYKGGSERKAVLNRMAYQAICTYLAADGRPPEGMTADDYVFVPMNPERVARLNPQASTDPNRPISNHTANGILKKYARRAGVDQEKAHIHGLRHAGARLRVEQQKARGGVDYVEIMQLLGHSSLAVTQIYSQTLLEDPEDPGGAAAAAALLPKGKARRQKRPAGEQEKLL